MEGYQLEILVLQRSWNLIGWVKRDGPYCYLRGGAVIRNWGTEGKGLGALAIEGPQAATVIDFCADVGPIHELTVVFPMVVEEQAVQQWTERLARHREVARGMKQRR